MKDMICKECVFKHLAGALSFAKEVISGHDETNELDHRIDFLGEIVNAEQHLELINEGLFNTISEFRKDLQARAIKVQHEDLQVIRDLYKDLEKLQFSMRVGREMKWTNIEEKVDIVFEEVNVKEYFELAYESIKLNLQNFANIYVLKSDVDLSEFEDVKVLDMNIFDVVKEDFLSENFIYTYENFAFINEIDARKIFQSFEHSKLDSKVKSYLSSKGFQGPFGIFDRIKPQTVNKKLFVENFDGISKLPDYPLTCYFYLAGLNTNRNNFQEIVKVTKEICCSVKTDLKKKKIVKWNDEGFKYISKYFKEKTLK